MKKLLCGQCRVVLCFYRAFDRVAAAQELEDSLEKPDNGNTVDLDSL